MSNNISGTMDIISKLKLIAFGLLVSTSIVACNEDCSSEADCEPPEQGEEITVDKLALNYFSIIGSSRPNFERKQKVGSESEKTEMRWYNPSSGDTSFEVLQAEDYFEDTIIAFGNNFQSSEDLMDINSQDSKLVFKMPDKVTGDTEQYTIQYTPFDLAGHSVADSKKAIQQDKGITTILNELNKMPDTLSFPEGSLCFIETYELASIPIFTHENIDSYPRIPSSLDNWEDRIVSEQGDYQFAEDSKVGSNNTHDARRLVYTSENDTQTTYSAMTYDDYYIDTHYVPTDKQSLANADPTQGLVDCQLVNDVAADFLEEEIPKYYFKETSADNASK